MRINKKLFCVLNIIVFIVMAVFAGLYTATDSGSGFMEDGSVFKYIASALFVVACAMNILLAWRAGGKVGAFPILMLIAIVLCFAGDIVLNQMFIAGMIVFAVGHIMLIASFTRVDIFGWKHLLPFIVLLVFSICFVCLYPEYDFGDKFPYVIVYAVIICAMLSMAVGITLDGTVNPAVRIISVLGALLFYASDFSLTLRNFAGFGTASNIVCLTTYYLALYLLAMLPAVYMAYDCTPQKPHMFVLKRLWCRAFQFCFHVAIPLLPYKSPVTLHSCDEAAELLVSKSMKKPLIVTDKGIVACGLVEPVKAALEAKGLPFEVYSDTVVNPTIQNAEEAAKLYNDTGCDCLIAIGGGSAMDCAKAAGCRIKHPNRTFKSMKGILKVFGKLPLFIAVPTTSGTGSETTIAAVIVDEKTRDKFTIIDFCLGPHYALLDPVMTKGLPKKMTSTTGMDALTHAVEAYIGGSTVKKTRTAAINAVKAIRYNLVEAYEHGDNMQARARMQYAAYWAGFAFTVSYVGYVHAVAHSLGGKYNTPHGLANSVILPYVLKDYGIYAQKKLAKLSRLTGVSEVNTSNEQACKEFIDWIEELNRKMDIPTKLHVDKEDIPALAKHADAEANPLYPVPYLMNAKTLESIYEEIRDTSEDTAE